MSNMEQKMQKKIEGGLNEQEQRYYTEWNKIIAKFMDFEYKAKYGDSGMKDIHGGAIMEGSIINADGYKSKIGDKYFHCVEFCDGVFGSDIYSDFEPISSYKSIEVVGHVKHFQKLEKNGGWSGNLGAAIISDLQLNYHSSWDWLMPVIIKINRMTEYDVIIYCQTCHINTREEMIIETSQHSEKTNDLIKIVYNAVIRFIQFYNSQNK